MEKGSDEEAGGEDEQCPGSDEVSKDGEDAHDWNWWFWCSV